MSGQAGTGRPLRTTAFFHLAEVTGPAKTLQPRLARLAELGRLEVVVPRGGRTAELYRPYAGTTELAYEPLTIPRTPRAVLDSVRGLTRQVLVFRRGLRRARPDVAVVVTTYLPAVLVAARLERVPAIVYVGEILDKRFVSSAARRLGARAVLRGTSALADAVVCCSQTVARQFDPSSTRVVTIYPGISPRHAEGDGERFRARHGLLGARPLLAVVGNLSAGRGQDLAVDALRILREDYPEARLALVGEPHPRPVDLAYRDELGATVGRLGLEDAVVFTGFVEEVADAYAAADVVVNPARFNEPFGRAALEALVAGRPVVATRVGALPEVLNHEGDALLVEPERPDRIAAAVRRLLEDPGLASRLGENGRRRVAREFTEEAGTEAFVELVSAVLGRRLG